MSGIVVAVVAGAGFGIFQATNRRANQELGAYRATFLLLAVGAATMVVFALVTRDVSLITTADPAALAWFAAAGFVHFVVGWTFLALSQQQVGAARTGAMLASTPLVGSLLAALILAEPITPLIGVGIVLVVTGVFILSTRGGQAVAERLPWYRRVPWFALGAAVSWGTSPILIRFGLAGLADPVVGVTFGLVTAAIAYGVLLLIKQRREAPGPSSPSGVRWSVAAGLLVAVCITLQWMAFDLIPVATAITLMQVSSPTVVLLAPVIVRSSAERFTPALGVGMLAVLAGVVVVSLGT